MCSTSHRGLLTTFGTASWQPHHHHHVFRCVLKNTSSHLGQNGGTHLKNQAMICPCQCLNFAPITIAKVKWSNTHMMPISLWFIHLQQIKNMSMLNLGSNSPIYKNKWYNKIPCVSTSGGPASYCSPGPMARQLSTSENRIYGHVGRIKPPFPILGGR